MNLFKSAVAAVAVAGAGYLGYKAIKSEKVKKAASVVGEVAVAMATAKAASKPDVVAIEVPAVVVPVSVVEHQVVEVEANKPFEGAMSVAKDVQDKPRKTIVEVQDKGVRVIQQHKVVKLMPEGGLNEKSAIKAVGL